MGGSFLAGLAKSLLGFHFDFLSLTAEIWQRLLVPDGVPEMGMEWGTCFFLPGLGKSTFRSGGTPDGEGTVHMCARWNNLFSKLFFPIKYIRY